MTVPEHFYILPHMKPDKNVCLNCGKEISLRAKYCSDKCRMAYTRKPEQKTNPNTNKAEQTAPEQPTRTSVASNDDFRSTLTNCDKTFYDRALEDFGEPYYNFTGRLREERCGYCKAPYKTNLSLNKYCSYQHYHESLHATKS